MPPGGRHATGPPHYLLPCAAQSLHRSGHPARGAARGLPNTPAQHPAGQTRQPEYLGINPMGKVPAILHGNILVTEQGAVFIYLSDL
ncbi:hypothetical protein, partial [Staphylococcus shinii]|uniref:hypothetical protein n=1 Tax=Staphylococcus shinii TaxID=2912228 RepID=UPI003F50FB45